MTVAYGHERPRQRGASLLTRARGRLLQIDRALLCATDPRPWLDRAAALARPADPDPRHGARVAALAARLARALGWSGASAERLRRAAALHDIGKLALPRRLLLHPGPLGPSERELLALHTHAARWLLGGLRHPVLRLAAGVGAAHHERWDGAGYPDGIAGVRIPLPARIVAACDVWDALTHTRPYRPALCARAAAETLGSMAGSALDPALCATLLHLLDRCDDLSATSDS